MQPPAQELCAKDLHDASWTFRHIYRGLHRLKSQHSVSWSLSNHGLNFYISGQPKRHLLTTGWSVFVSAKKLLAGDSVLFVRYWE